MKKIIYSSMLFFCVVFINVSPLNAQNNNYSDGVYEGQFSFIKVKVVIEKGKISDIEILEHGGGGKKYEEMVKPMISNIIENQSTEIDGVTGATVSSSHLKNAVENALSKAIIIDKDTSK